MDTKPMGYNAQGTELLNHLRDEHGRHQKDIGLKLVGNALNEKGFVGNGDMIFKNKDGERLIASMHAGKDYLRKDDGQMYL